MKNETNQKALNPFFSERAFSGLIPENRDAGVSPQQPHGSSLALKEINRYHPLTAYPQPTETACRGLRLLPLLLRCWAGERCLGPAPPSTPLPSPAARYLKANLKASALKRDFSTSNSTDECLSGTLYLLP